jgi:hopene-associated glycosyltransferase HpnB
MQNIPIITFVSSINLLIWLFLDLFHGKFWKPLIAAPAAALESWPDIDIIVPARDEADALPKSLPSLLAQDYPGAWRIILVDDHSSDGTGDIAHKLAQKKDASDRLLVVEAPNLPPGWANGKLAALEAGLAQSKSEFVLFTDADIVHPKTSLREIAARAVANKLDLTSLMVTLHCVTFAEKLLIPAFVFFFAMLYPFCRANDPKSRVAAAAGGVMLVRRAALNNSGGLERIKSKLIDDCALAKSIKQNGGRIELTLSYDVISLRAYPKIADVWRMVARTAYTQLHYSVWRLAGTILGMSILFCAPLLIPFAADTQTKAVAGMAWAIMSVLYLPTILFYRLPFYWALTLPAAAVIYVAATIDSARLYWQGKGGQWKGRTQAS